MRGNARTWSMSRGVVAEEHIVKVQRPLMATDPRARNSFLVYAEGRRYQAIVEPDPELIAALGADPKGYFRATWNGWRWTIHERVNDRRW